MTAAGDPSAPADAVIRGDVTAVKPGVSNSWKLTEDGEDRKILPFGDENSESDTYHLTIEVSDVIAQGPKSDLGPTLVVGIALPPGADPARVRSDFERVDDAVFFVRESPVFDYEPGVLGISENGTLIGFVDGDSVHYPLLEAPEAFTADGENLGALKSAAST